MEVLGVPETLHGEHLLALGLHRQHQARPHVDAVDHDGASAADAVLATEMGAGEAELVPQEIGEGDAHLCRGAAPLAVHDDLDFAGHDAPPCPLSAASLPGRSGPGSLLGGVPASRALPSAARPAAVVRARRTATLA